MQFNIITHKTELLLIPRSNRKLVSFFAKSLNKLSKDFIQDRRLNLILESSYFKRFRSSLQSHP